MHSQGITRLSAETGAAFPMGTKDIDAEWDSFLKELVTIGIEKAPEINQAADDRAYKQETAENRTSTRERARPLPCLFVESTHIRQRMPLS